MSSLIEQAILDAKDLKEAAVKNAEQMIIEKYADEIKINLEQLLEQDLGLGMGAGSAAMPAMPGTTTAAPLPVTADQAKKDKDKVPDQLEYAAFDGMTIGKTKYPGLNEEVEIDLTSLSEYEIDPSKGPTKRNIKESFDISENDLLEMLADRDDGSDYASDYAMEEEVPTDNVSDDDLLSLLDDEDEEEKDTASSEYDDDMSLVSEDDGEFDVYEESDFYLDEELDEQQEELEEAITRVDYNRNYKSGRDYGLGALTAEDTHTRMLSDLSDQVEELEEENTKVKQQNESLKKKLAEASKLLAEAAKQQTSTKESFQQMKGKLEEVQLMNAKLLFSNKVLADASLNERQKNKIVESLSSADSIEKIKIVYETLQSAVEDNTSRAPKSLSEAVSRRSSPLSIRSVKRDDRDANPINETLNRMRILAGINK